MTSIGFRLAQLFVWLACFATVSSFKNDASERVLVRYKPGAEGFQAAESLGLSLLKQVGRRRTQVYKITDGSSVESILDMLKELPEVESATRDFQVQPTDYAPDDPQSASQWYLKKVNASAAWSDSTGSSKVKVCIIDSGAQANHPDLAANIVKGFSTIDGEDPNNFDDDLGHGTHVAGIVAAVGNNAVGVTGVAWKASLVICRFRGKKSGYISDAVECYDRCREEGALITANPYAATFTDSVWESEVADGTADGNELLVVAAAGNDGKDVDAIPYYPACFKSDNVVSVGSSTAEDTVSSFSNYGSTSVDLFAPGSSILSTWKGSSYQWMQGTSMATPIVAAAAALLQAAAMDAGVTLTNAELKRHLLAGVDQLPAYAGKAVSGGRLNIEGSLKSLEAALVVLQQGPVKSFTLQQTFFARVSYSCRRWSTLSESAYRETIHRVLGIDDLSFTCKKVGSNRLRIVATAKTAEVSQAQALELLQQLNTEMQMSTFKTQVLKIDSKASPPFRVGNSCVVGISPCGRKKR